MQNNPVLKLSFEFSLEVIKFCDRLVQNKRFVIANQLLKSATSVGANIIEAQNAESLSDFIHKFKIAAKESEESEYWLLLCKLSEEDNMDRLINMSESLSNIIGKIISTSKRKLKDMSKC
jgi:four helix bundle protein